MKARPDLEALIAAERAERPLDTHRQASFEQVCRALAAGHVPLSIPVEPLGVVGSGAIGSGVGAKGAAAGAKAASSAAVGAKGAAVGVAVGVKSTGAVAVGVKALATTAVVFGVGSAGYLWTEESSRAPVDSAILSTSVGNRGRGSAVHAPAASLVPGAARSVASSGSGGAVSAASSGSGGAVVRPPSRSEPAVAPSRLPERSRQAGPGGGAPLSVPVTLGPEESLEPAATPGGGFNDELRLLERAKRESSAGNAQQARAALAEHRQRFRGGVLVPEREALSAILDCSSENGSADDVERDRRRFAAFIRDFPSSPLAARVRRACSGDGE